eukprot:13353330-Ditylum_brightwellii.AAC.1
MEFPTPTGIKTKKIEDKDILEVLENRIPTSWKFHMDKEGFDASSSMIKKCMKICVCYKECKPKETKENSTACKSHSKRGEKRKAKHKANKRLTMTEDKILYNVIPMAEDITIATTPQKSVGSP